MQKAVVFLLLICVSACTYFDSKKISSQDIYKEEQKTFNWSAVDAYPTFSVCDKYYAKAEKKTCFENTLSQHITSRLKEETIIVTQDIEDTLILEFQISETGKITVKNIDLKASTESEIPDIKNMLSRSLNTLPKIFPAIKRNQPVKTVFKLPIVIKVN